MPALNCFTHRQASIANAKTQAWQSELRASNFMRPAAVPPTPSHFSNPITFFDMFLTHFSHRTTNKRFPRRCAEREVSLEVAKLCNI